METQGINYGNEENKWNQYFNISGPDEDPDDEDMDDDLGNTDPDEDHEDDYFEVGDNELIDDDEDDDDDEYFR